MTVNTTYCDYWMWGKMDLDVIAGEYIIGAVKEKYGAEMWTQSKEGFINAINEMENYDGDLTCENAKTLLEVLAEFEYAKSEHLLSHQSQFSDCGTCNVLSNQFLTELVDYVGGKYTKWGTEVYFGGEPSFIDLMQAALMGDFADLAFAMMWVKADTLLHSLSCDYSCVHEKVGVDFWADYVEYNAYILTRFLITFTIEEGYIPNCQLASLTSPMNSLLAYRVPGVYRVGQY